MEGVRVSVLTPYYQADGITIFLGDCREVLPHVKADVVVMDPPYGIGWHPRVNNLDSPWKDTEQFDPVPLLNACPRRLFFGGNYFADKLPPSPDWLTWIKRPIAFDFSNDRRSYSTVELAWSDFGCGARFKVHVWDGGMRAGDPSNRTFVHPAQKPVEVMRWCLGLAPPGIILDPFMGSGTTLVAAKQLGRRAIGIEISPEYCAIAVKRLAQTELFAAPAVTAKAEQLAIGGIK